MASISDVEDAIETLIEGVLFPNGTDNPSLVGYPIIIETGWPDPATLDNDIVEPNEDGIPVRAHVSVYPLPSERNTTRYPNRREENVIPAWTYSISAVGQVVTIAGAPPSPYVRQNLAAWVNGQYYVTGATPNETPAQLATALAALIGADVSGVTVSGATITLPATADLGDLVVGTTGSVWREVRRQERQFQINVWTSNPASRAAIADAFDPVMADTTFLPLADGTGGRLRYVGAREDDFVQKQRIYRRSLIYTVEYATTITEIAPQIVVAVVDAFGPEGQPITGLGALDFSNPDNSGLLPLV